MKTINNNTKLNIPNSILLIGEPGAGKTSLSCQFPNTFVLDVDGNLAGPVRYLRSQNKQPTFSYDTVLFTDKATLDLYGIKDQNEFFGPPDKLSVPRQWRFRLAAFHLDAAVADPKIETIVISSFTTFNDVLMDEVYRQYNIPFDQKSGKLSRTVTKRPDKEGFAIWDGYLKLAKNTILELKATGKRIIVEAHVALESKGDTNIERIAIPGQLGDTIAGYFEEVWRIDIESKMIAGKIQNSRILRTSPMSGLQQKLGLKSSVQLPAVASINIEELLEQLNK